MADISEEQLVATFDQLVFEEIIVYGPHTKHQVEDEGYPFEFRICPALTTKPHRVGALNPAFNHTRKYGPGSDLFCPDERLNLCQLNKTHILALNLFCVDRPQLLILTLDSQKRQYEPLDEADFKAALEVLQWKSWYVIFNCGDRGGCSRVHKHMQGLKGPPYAFETLRRAQDGDGKVPFKFFMRHIENRFNISAVQTMYDDMLTQCKHALLRPEEEVLEFCPHNVVLWEDWMVVIPRDKGAWEGASTNTGGMLGSIWVLDQAEVDKWLQLGCANVLRKLGVPPQGSFLEQHLTALQR